MNVRLHWRDELHVAGVEVNLARLLIDQRAYAEAGSALHDAIRIRRIGRRRAAQRVRPRAVALAR
jgi:hypothetical protein